MKDFDTAPLVWAKDEDGQRYLCPLDALTDPNSVRESEKGRCVDDISRLGEGTRVPGDGKIRFAESASLN